MDVAWSGSPTPWLAALVEQTTEAVAVLDDQAQIVWVNAAVERTLGGPPESFLGRSVVEILHPDDIDRAIVALTAVDQGARPLPGIIRLLRGDGTYGGFDISVSAVDLGAAGSVTMVGLRDNELQEAHWRFVTAVSAGVPFLMAIGEFVAGLSNAVDGPMGIAVGDDGARHVVGCLPPEMVGAGPDGAVDRSAGGPYQRAVGNARPVVIPIDDLPEHVAAAARERGAGACVAMAVDDPGSRSPILVTQWPTHAAMGALLVTAMERRPRQALQLAAERAEAMRRLEELAHHDELTGLMNRQRFMMLLEQLHERGQHYGICYVDLDHFKPVNDDYGHQAGDAVIAACGKRLRRLCQPGDLAGRIGGDEFALALIDIDRDGLASVSARLVAVLGAPYEFGEQVFDVGASVGAAIVAPGETHAAVVAAADAALYEAKRAGRRTWRLARGT